MPRCIVHVGTMTVVDLDDNCYFVSCDPDDLETDEDILKAVEEHGVPAHISGSEWGLVNSAKKFFNENHYSNRTGPPENGYPEAFGAAMATLGLLLGFIDRNVR